METTDNQEVKLSVGMRLRMAREAADMSVVDVSQQIKLSAKQIEILENDGFDELGLVFSRGFVRNYARLLGLDANSLIADMSSTMNSKTEPLSIHDEHIPLTTELSKYWLAMAGLAIALVIGVPLLVYHWLAADDTPITLPTVAKTVAPSATNARLPASPETATQQANTAPSPATNTATTNPATAASTASAENTAMGRLHLQFAKDSWVEIRDGKQHTILTHLYRAGETAEISGMRPLSVIIGNAAGVTLKYNDQVIDLVPYTPFNVAKLTLQ